MSDLVRLNVGAGPCPADGWVHTDVVAWSGARWHPYRPAAAAPKPGCYLQGPLPGPGSLPFPDGCADGAVGHHVLQMVPYQQLVPWLAEVHRVLKPGAWLRLTLPDLAGAVRAWEDGQAGWFPIADDLELTVDGKLCLYLAQAGATRSVFTPEWAATLCTRAGFTVVERRTFAAKPFTSGPEWLCDLDSRLAESVVVEAQA